MSCHAIDCPQCRHREEFLEFFDKSVPNGTNPGDFIIGIAQAMAHIITSHANDGQELSAGRDFVKTFAQTQVLILRDMGKDGVTIQ